MEFLIEICRSFINTLRWIVNASIHIPGVGDVNAVLMVGSGLFAVCLAAWVLSLVWPN